MATDLDQKKTFLLQGSELYAAMIEHTPNQVLRRYLAFRIIVNAMAFEDVVTDRQDQRMREIRNVLLAHKQESDFFEGLQAAADIRRITIDPLVAFMKTKTGSGDPAWALPELAPGISKQKFDYLIPLVMDRYEQDFLAGNRLINNFLCFTGTSVQETTKHQLPGVFYRYHSARALYDLAEYIFNNASKDPDLRWLARHAKLDKLLHAQNMADCALKDQRNTHSVDGLLEVMVNEPIGDPSALQALDKDPSFRALYSNVRKVRNKLIGHMDIAKPLTDLLNDLDALPDSAPADLVNKVEDAVSAAARSNIAIRTRYTSSNVKLGNSEITSINGVTPAPY